ncbi:hypothetical protein J2X65_001543 [Ancylobacter sp. 3268]|uniref:hypothetical protein n=1 Tax=Ancylobacter sp. 3268 TaxID=2817752 RepID=UPI002866AA7C|nr:hypothetical protein [Ancylobacter sp. 3268]MDR6952192.1 hypothetical protein [Ancylobacter sp. 3268]
MFLSQALEERLQLAFLIRRHLCQNADPQPDSFYRAMSRRAIITVVAACRNTPTDGHPPHEPRLPHRTGMLRRSASFRRQRRTSVTD